jgi:hypothetical protein
MPNLPPTNGGSGFRIHGFHAQPEALMGCERQPVEPEIRFLDGRVEPFIRFPLTRWQRLTEWEALLVAPVLALLFAVIIEVFVRLIRRY